MREKVECVDALHAAYAYLLKQTAAFPGPWAPLLASPAYKALCEAIDVAVLADDLEATKRACRHWWTAAIAYSKGG